MKRIIITFLLLSFFLIQVEAQDKVYPGATEWTDIDIDRRIK